MSLDELFNHDLNLYIQNITSEEPLLLKNLRAETAAITHGSQMLTGPVEGKLLQMLVKLVQAKACLEIGTFTGYSALQIASGLEEDGKLVTCEIREDHAQIAQKYFKLSPYGHKIQILLGDATQTISELSDIFDFIFIDADKANYPFYYDMLISKLRKGGLMVIDNALWGGKVVSPQDKNTHAIHLLNMKAHLDKTVETVMLSVRDGILLVRKL